MQHFKQGSPGTLNYYIATAFDRIYLAPCGDVNLVGVWLNAPFLKNSLDKIGVELYVPFWPIWEAFLLAHTHSVDLRCHLFPCVQYH